MSKMSRYNIYFGKQNKLTFSEGQIVSCDPGIKNFAMRIEYRSLDGDIKMIMSDRIDISDTVYKSRYEQLHEFLDTHREQIIKCKLFIVERQLPKNFEATAMSNHVLSYFMTLRHLLPSESVIIDVTAKNKGYQLGAPKKCIDYWLKRWAIIRAEALFKCRNDTEGLSMLYLYDKKDDISDTAIQIEAVFRMLGFKTTTGFDLDGGPQSLNEVKLEWKSFCLKSKEMKKASKPPKIPKGPKPPKGPKGPKSPKVKIPKSPKQVKIPNGPKQVKIPNGFTAV